MDRRMKAKAGRFGITPAFLQGKQADAGITAAATVVVPINSPFRKLFVERFSVVAQVLAIGSGVITVTLNKKPVGGAVVPLTAATSIKVDVQTAQVVGNIAILAAATDAQRIVNEGDSLYLDIIAAGTVATQPVGLVGSVEVSVLE